MSSVSSWPERTIAVATAIGVCLSGVGICATIYYASANLNESRMAHREAMQEDQAMRELLQTPYLGFERMSNLVPIVPDRGFVDFKRDKSGTVVNENHLLDVRNYGLGPAIDVKVTWDVESINGQRVKSKGEDAQVTSPLSILPSQSAKFGFFPKCIREDRDRTIKSVTGWVTLEYESLNGNEHRQTQEFFVHTHYDDAEPFLYFNFSNPRKLDFSSWRRRRERKDASQTE